jgi:hypothetical protein
MELPQNAAPGCHLRGITALAMRRKGKYVKRGASFLVLTWIVFSGLPVRAAEPQAADAMDKAAALKSATAWLTLLDKPDYVAAGAGVSEESLATINYPSADEKAHTMGAILASIGPTSRMGGQHEMTRKLERDNIKHETSCGGCGIRDGEYFVFTYDLTNKWTNHHMFQATAGTQVLYMLKEKDGSWKAARIYYNQSGEKHGPAK